MSRAGGKPRSCQQGGKALNLPLLPHGSDGDPEELLLLLPPRAGGRGAEALPKDGGSSQPFPWGCCVSLCPPSGLSETPCAPPPHFVTLRSHAVQSEPRAELTQR